MLLPAVWAISSFVASSQAQTVPLVPLPRGFLRHMGGMRSITAGLSTRKPGGITRLPAKVSHALYGKAWIGGKPFFVVLASVGRTRRLFVDSNGDGNLANDPPTVWRERSGNANPSGEATVRLKLGPKLVSVSVIIVQSAGKRLSILPDFGYTGRLKVGSGGLLFYLADGADHGFPGGTPEGSILGFDRDGDGIIAGAAEQYDGDHPFTLEGTSLVLKSVNTAALEATFVPGEAVPEVPLPSRFAVGAQGPTFTSTGLDGKSVSFPSDYSGKVVLVYAWATWSKPSIDWLPRIANAYQTYHHLNFDVLGVCLNRMQEAQAVRTEAAGMPWATVFDGKSWSGPVARQLGVSTLPFILLVDSRTGKVVATMSDLAGDKLGSAIRAAAVGNR